MNHGFVIKNVVVNVFVRVFFENLLLFKQLS